MKMGKFDIVFFLVIIMVGFIRSHMTCTIA